ncbi:MAG: hypothetical protein RLZZ536_1245, partial [Planctomycetota bacterium]
PLILKTNSQGRLIDENGRLIDEDGYLINSDGKYVDASGNVLTVPPATPVYGGNPVRLSGGEVRTKAGGTVSLSASGTLLLQGAVGGLIATNGTVSATSTSVTVASSAAAVTVTDRISAADQLLITGVDINVLAGGQLRAWASGGDVRLRGTDEIYLEATSGMETAGTVRAADFAYLQANYLTLDGRITSDSGRVRLNAMTDAAIAAVVAANTIEVNSGISANWIADRLENQAIARTDLAAGGISIEGAGSLQSKGVVLLNAGATLSVNSGASQGAGTKARPRPIVSTESRTETVITGYTRQSDGITKEQEEYRQTTTTTKQVGTDEFKTGTYNYTMNVTLTQDGYYNPRAPEGAKKREYFIEGIDYFNASIPWTTYGASSVTGDYKDKTNYKVFSQLNDLQRSAVLKHLGYMPLYNFSYTNYQKEQTLEGVTSTQNATPSWANNPQVIQLILLDEWKDKYISLPAGAADDLIRASTVGTSTTTQETVGKYRDKSTVNYTQTKSTFSGNQYNGNQATDFDNSGQVWTITFGTDGAREFSVNDGRSVDSQQSKTFNRIPELGLGNPVPIEGGNSPGNPNPSIGGSWWAVQPLGFASATDSVTFTAGSASSRNVHVGYYYTEGRTGNWTTLRDSHGTPGNVQFWNQDVNNQYSDGLVDVFGVGAYSATGTMVDVDGKTQGWQDALNGLVVPAGILVEVFEHINYGGWYQSYTGPITTNLPADKLDKVSSAKIYMREWQTTTHSIYETQWDWRAYWIEKWHDISDTRLNLNYTTSTIDYPIYGKRERFETVTLESVYYREKEVTKWKQVPVEEQQSSLVTSRLPSAETVPWGLFSIDAINSAGTVTIDAGSSVGIAGRVVSTAGAIQISSAGSFSADGGVSDGLTAVQSI